MYDCTTCKWRYTWEISGCGKHRECDMNNYIHWEEEDEWFHKIYTRPYKLEKDMCNIIGKLIHKYNRNRTDTTDKLKTQLSELLELIKED